MNKFAKACKECYEEWEASLPDIDSLPEPEYSKKHINRMERLFDRMRGDKYHYLTRKAVKVMIAAAVIFALMLCAFAIPSSRRYIIEHFDGFGMFTVSEHNGNAVNGIEVGYIPEGFELTEYSELDKVVDFMYESPKGEYFSISKSASNINVLFNIENGQIEEFTRNNITYSFAKNELQRDYVMWSENDYIYCIDGTLSKEELLKIAQNLK